MQSVSKVLMQISKCSKGEGGGGGLERIYYIQNKLVEHFNSREFSLFSFQPPNCRIFFAA